jgi:hypothetical protein
MWRSLKAAPRLWAFISLALFWGVICLMAGLSSRNERREYDRLQAGGRVVTATVAGQESYEGRCWYIPCMRCRLALLYPDAYGGPVGITWGDLSRQEAERYAAAGEIRLLSDVSSAYPVAIAGRPWPGIASSWWLAIAAAGELVMLILAAVALRAARRRGQLFSQGVPVRGRVVRVEKQDVSEWATEGRLHYQFTGPDGIVRHGFTAWFPEEVVDQFLTDRTVTVLVHPRYSDIHQLDLTGTPVPRAERQPAGIG